MPVESQRLTLIPLNHAQLQLWLRGRGHLLRALGLQAMEFELDKGVAEEIREALPFWHKATALHPQDYPWFTNWEIVLKSERIAVGGISMGGISTTPGAVKVGYFLDRRYQGWGLATEALRAVFAWGKQDPRLQRFVAETARDNLPSQRLLQRLGFATVLQTPEGMYWEKQVTR
jgi:ribosomal-protein-alanine N-acetyltransferase